MEVSKGFIVFITFISSHRRNIFIYFYLRLLDVYILIFRDLWSQEKILMNFRYMHVYFLGADKYDKVAN